MATAMFKQQERKRQMGIGRKVEPPRDASQLPREVKLLLRREREVATIVYEFGAATATQVQARLSCPLANASVRSMLNRLVAKGILTRFLTGRKFIYLPALSCSESRRLALLQFVQDHFAGSLRSAALAMQEMLIDP